MDQVVAIAIVLAVHLFKYADAHGFHHPSSKDQDPSFENIVEQKYFSLPTNFISKHERQLAEDFTHDSGNQTIAICDPQCYWNEADKRWLSCDDLILSGYTCSYSETNICPGKCQHCGCSCERTCTDGRSCDEWITSNPTMTCDELQKNHICDNCRGCSRCHNECTQKCSMRDKNIKGSHECGTWYKKDPKYTAQFLKENAVVTGAENQACTCDGCNGADALSYCPNDTPYEQSDERSNYMDIETAKNLGKIGKMRLTINDDMVDPDKCRKNDFCAKHTCLEGDVGKKINNCVFERGPKLQYLSSKACIVTCTEEDILTKEKSFMVRRRFDWLKTFMADLLSLKPTQDPITLNQEKIHFIEGLRDPVTKAIQEYNNTDLVVVVTMRPAVTDQVSGYAIALQRDSWRRATVGLFNWCPNTVKQELYKIEVEEEKLNNRDKAELLYSKASDYRLMVHEVLHLAGAIKYDPYYYINKYGKQPCPHQIYVDEVEEWSGHRVRKLRTPKLLALAREQFGCSSLTGVPLEDHPVGYGSHWESRVFGPEIMSYGENSGESYLSDLTLAYLEDTGYFVVNYTKGGRLNEPTASKVGEADIPGFLMKNKDELQKKVGEAMNRSKEITPGYTTWGRNQGCDFVTGSPKNWPESYRCESMKTAGCTPDNKMSARCTLETWGETKIASSTIRCEPEKDEPWGGVRESKVQWKCIKNNAGGSIPSEYHHLAPGKPLAGYNDAMDYVPHLVGYWNCRDVRPKTISPLDVASEAGSSQNVSTSWDKLFGSLSSDSRSIKGQTQCESCRCFRSSLVPAADFSKFDPNFPKYGLCYVANCYSEDYLQVGIRGAHGLYWYGCNPAGGKVYVALFVGALECPVAKEFCSFEPHSNVLHTETDAILEWVFYGVIAGVVLILLITLRIFWSKIDHKVHFCCGIDQDQKDWDKIMIKRQGKHSTSAYILTVIGVIWALAAAGLVLFGIYSFLIPFLANSKPFWDSQIRQAPAFIAIGVFTLVISLLAVSGAWKNKPTLTLIIYFYACCSAVSLCAFIPFVHWILYKPFELILESQWLKYKNLFPESWHGYNSTTAMEHITTVTLPQYSLYFAIAATVFIFSVIAGIVCSILQLTVHVLVRNFEVVMNLGFCIGGGVLVSFAAAEFMILDVVVFSCAIIPASFLFLCGFIGVLAACQKHATCFKVWMVFAVLCLLITLACASLLVWISLSPVQDVVLPSSPSACPTETPSVCKEPTPMCCSCAVAVDLVNIDMSNISITSASVVTTAASVINATPGRGAMALESFTRCEHSCYDVPGYSCTEVESTTSAFPVAREKSFLVQLDPYIRSLDDNARAEISFAMSESLGLSEFDVEELIAWLTAYLRIYAISLYICCLIICALFVTNRLIIHWNTLNDNPHDDGPMYNRLATSVSKQRMQSPKHMRNGNEKSLVKSIKNGVVNSYKALGMGNDEITPVHSLVLQDIVEITIDKDPVLGLGMSMSAVYDEADSDMRLVVNELLYHEDGSPGPALIAGVQVGDQICSLEGNEITTFEAFKRDISRLDTVTMEFARAITDSTKLKDREAYPEIVLLHIRRHTAAVPLGAKLTEVFSDGDASFSSAKKASYVVVKDVWNGPFLKGGLAVDDVILNVQNYFVDNLKTMRELIKGAREFDVVVKRMSVSDGEKGYREEKTFKCDVDIDGQLGLGLKLKEIRSGLGDSVSKRFLYVQELKQFSDGTAGPALVAGVQQHDLILKINNKPVHRIRDARDAIRGQRIASMVIRRMVREYSSQHPYHPDYHRSANEITVLIQLNGDEPTGMSLSEAYGADSSYPFLVVQDVRSGSAADIAGVQYHDIIWKAAGKDVYQLDEMKRCIDGLSEFELVLRRHEFENHIGIGASNFDLNNSKII